MRTFCFHENIAWEHFVFMRTSHENTMQTFVENKFVLMSVCSNNLDENVCRCERALYIIAVIIFPLKERQICITVRVQPEIYSVPYVCESNIHSCTLYTCTTQYMQYHASKWREYSTKIAWEQIEGLCRLCSRLLYSIRTDNTVQCTLYTSAEVFNLWYTCHLWHFDQKIVALCLYFYVALLIQ